MASTAPRPAEVTEEDADPKVKAVFDDIKSTLRVPVVNLVFRLLAAHPYFLEVAWRQLKPNMQTAYAEQSADALRALAVERVARLGQAPHAPDAAGPTLAVFHYVNPKLLIAVQALRAAVNGQAPRLEELTRDQKRQIAPGVPEGAPTITLVDPESPPEQVQRTLEDIRRTAGSAHLNSDYRALAQWPEYLEAAWTALKPLAGTPEFRAITLALRRQADEVVLTLPYRIEANPHTLRHAGLSEREIDSVRAIVDSISRLLPGLVASVAFLSSGAEGQEAARRSPYPATLL